MMARLREWISPLDLILAAGCAIAGGWNPWLLGSAVVLGLLGLAESWGGLHQDRETLTKLGEQIRRLGNR